jgi:hypothetical protein
MTSTDGGRPRLGHTVAEVIRVTRARWPTLLVAGLVVFIPLGLVDVEAEHLGEAVTDEELGGGLLLAASLALFAAAIAALAGEVIYAGIVASTVVAQRRGDRRRVRAALGDLRLASLAAVDVLSALVIAVGFVALIVPGFVFLAWFALVAPAVEIERVGIIASFRRSRELVRGHFWLVSALVIPLVIAQEALSSAAQSVSWWGLGEDLAGDWAGAVLANLLTSPLYAVAVTVLFLELRGEPRELSSGDRSSPGTPARSSRQPRREGAP